MAGPASAPAHAPPPLLDLGQKSIRLQVALLVLGIVLPAFAVAVAYLLHQRATARALAGEKVALLAHDTAQRLAARLREHELMLAYLAAQPSVRAMDPSRCDRAIQDLTSLRPEHLGVGTRDLRGAPVCIFRRDVPSAQQMMEYAWFTRSLDNERFQASDAFLVPIARRWATMLTAPVRDESDRQVGVLVLPVDLLRLGESLLVGGAPDTVVTVLDSNFRILMRSVDAERWTGQETAGQARGELLARPEGLLRAQGADGVERLFAFRQVEGMPWRVTAGVPLEVVYGAADRALRNGILASALLLLVALAVAWRLGLAMVRPLDVLVRTAARVTGGDVMARVPVLDGAPEFSAVAQGFNRMLDARVAAEAALRRSQERLSITLDSIGDGVIATDTAGIVTRMNAAAQRLTGWSFADARGRSLQEVYRVSDAATGLPVTDLVQRALVQGEVAPATQARVLLARDGQRHHLADKATPILDHHRTLRGVVVVFSDVTRQHAIQSALNEAYNFSRQVLDGLPVGVNVRDLERRYREWNPAMARIVGAPPEQVIGKTMAEAFPDQPPELHAVIEDATARAERGELVLRPDMAIEGPNGVLWASATHSPLRNAAGEIIGTLTTVRDITARKLAEQALRDSEESLSITLQSIGDAVIATDAEGLVTRMNPVAERMTGWPLTQARGVPLAQVFRIVRSDTRAPAPDPIERVLAAGQTVGLAHHTTLLTRTGEEHQIADSAAPIRDSQGRIVGVVLVFSDVSEQYRLQREVVESERRYRALTELSSDWYWEQDAQLRFVRIDGKLQDILGRPNESLLGKTRWEVQGFTLSQAQWDAHRAVLEARLPFRDFQMHNSDANGRDLWVSISGAPILDENGEFVGYRGVGRDITAEKTAADQIHALAFYDALTELPNRRLLIERLKQALAVHARTRRQAALLFIDLDNFKTLNDTLGHETGDLLLRQVAQRIVACTRETDTVARLGGDEFVVMLEDLSEDLEEAAQQAERVGNKILAAFDPAFVLGAHAHRSTPSIGVTLFGKGGKSVDDLLKHADLAMYQAKGAGRNTLRMFDQGMQAAVDGRAAMEAQLREALLRGQMRLVYQPVVQLDGRVIGAEALVRWQHPLRGTVSPGEFIGLAESTRLIIPLGQWVLHAACRQLAMWQDQPHLARLTVAVNVSANQFKEPSFVEGVFQALQQTGADPRLLKLELTESLLADNVEDIIAKMTRLRAVGIDFSLDDFGTGYSSLSYLKRLPLAQLKIDQSFVRDVLIDPNDAAIARTIVALGGSLGLSVIAEGVETAGQQQFLREIGCHAFQGYLFGRPMPAAELDAFVLAHAATARARELP